MLSASTGGTGRGLTSIGECRSISGSLRHHGPAPCPVDHHDRVELRPRGPAAVEDHVAESGHGLARVAAVAGGLLGVLQVEIAAGSFLPRRGSTKAMRAARRGVVRQRTCRRPGGVTRAPAGRRGSPRGRPCCWRKGRSRSCRRGRSSRATAASGRSCRRIPSGRRGSARRAAPPGRTR